VAGVAVSPNFPTNGTKPAYQPASNSSLGANGFVTELDTSQTPSKQLVYSTYIGGTESLFTSPLRPGDAATDVAVDSTTGKIYLTGGATTTNFPVINTCTQMSTIGPNDQADAFVSILDPSAACPTPVTGCPAQLQFSTYLGGSDIDVAGAIARDSTNKVYVAGVTFSGDFPVTGNAFQLQNNAFSAGHTNAFVTELDPGSTVCPTPVPSPSITITPVSTATTQPTATPTAQPATPTPTATPTVVPVTPHISSVPGTILVGSSFDITGSGFTSGSVVNFFVATANGPVNVGPLTPTKPHTSSLMTVPVPDTISLGQGFVSVVVVNTDTGFTSSNPAYALLQGNAADGIPSLTSINGKGLAATSSDPSFATDNVETVVVQGTTVTLGGTGFDAVNGVAVDIFCACPPPGKVTFFINPGASLTPTQVSFPLPAKGLPKSPATGPGSFVVSNAGTAHTYAKKSNAVSAPLGAQIHVFSVGQSGSTITVNGSGFSILTVINFFNKQGGGVVNVGGLKPGGGPMIPLNFINENTFSFTKPKFRRHEGKV